ncbi:biotin--[acetyl-CoA-carboxylase] ligase [Anoxybacter fermentans]|uniref:Bifunctional ligase/repressor BirA n=1 Tax=Anoxybacter fermentans TaxID=1323375 RepID=A0A3Q9HTE6_9FIRM|nr:biotin--[acetyl-CoA-carboxylase] ligase [Anoxybacter fermentans]
MRQTILKLLSEQDTYISGQELSERLGVSRTAIWKHISALKEKGYEIESIPNKGYRLLNTPNRLIPEEILRNLKTTTLGKKIVFFEEIDSTNTQAKESALDYPEGTIFLAEAQTKGRGRLGRSWSSIPGKGIWCSVLLKPSLDPTFAGQFPLLTAVAIAETFHNLGVDAKIKWPNDLLVDGKKICGILTEMGAELDRINYLVIGFGINVKHKLEDFPKEIRTIATSLEMVLKKEVDRVQLLCDILLKLEKYYFQLLKEGFEPIRKLWKEYTCTLGHEVKISRFNELPLFGKALDLNPDGSLLFELPDGQIINVHSGEIGLQ